MRLYHYSNADIKDKIKVGYYGLNSYTVNDTAITILKRAFYYTRPEPEALLRHCRFLYIAEIEPSQLYDINQDKDGYNYNIHLTLSQKLRAIKRIYKGVKYNIGSCEIVNLFYDTKIKDKITLTE